MSVVYAGYLNLISGLASKDPNTYNFLKQIDSFLTTFSPNIAGSGFTNPMTTLGDIIVGGSQGLPTRLPIGTNGYILTADNTKTLGLAWEASSGGLTPPITITSATANPVLTVNSTSTTSHKILSITSSATGGSTTVASIDANSASFSGTVLEITCNAGFALNVTLTDGSGGGSAITAQGNSGNTLVAANNSFNRACISAHNSGGCADVYCANHLELGGVAFASLPSSSNFILGASGVVYCKDAKNFADDGITVGTIASGSGHGAWVCYVNGSWRTMC